MIRLLIHSLAVVFASLAPLSTACAELSSDFSEDTQHWRASDGEVMLSHHTANGGHLRGQSDGAQWSFRSPESWSGNWSAYRVIRFDLGITSGDYADAETAGLVRILGENGQTMEWQGPTPLWSWTRYEISLAPASFNVDEATFNAIVANVAELQILGEFNDSVNETVGIDGVTVTSVPVQAFTSDLVERFTDPVVANGKVAGWSPVDDCTLTAEPIASPLFGLKATDWRQGLNFKIASPASWAGDWRAFSEVRFDIRWTSDVSDATNAGNELVTIFSANGTVLKWSRPLVRNQWTHVVLPLEAASFGVDQATFENAMAHVSQIWIRGEFNNGLDQTTYDNIVVAVGQDQPPAFSTMLSEDFDTGPAGWLVYDNASLSWSANGGISSGAISSTDTGQGLAKFASPDAWSGDWSAFRSLRFLIRPDRVIGTDPTLIADAAPVLTIHGFNNQSLQATLARPMREWTPYTIDLTPATFGVDQATFDAVITNVAHITLMSDLVFGLDTSSLDFIAMDPDGFPERVPTDLFSGFDSSEEGWRKGGRNSNATIWTILTQPSAHGAIEGNPPGSITINDEEATAYWFSPESWAGDWRGRRSLSFDLKIIDGTDVLPAGDMLRIFSQAGTLTQTIATAQLPVPGAWVGYEFELSAAAFGVSEDLYQRVMRDVSRVGIRSEWISGPETEGLDNVRITKGDEGYWTWLGGYLGNVNGLLATVAGKTGDIDGDGQTNDAEFLSLTAPDNAADRFETNFSFDGSAGEVGFHAKAGRVYQLEYSPDLGQSEPWLPLGPEIMGDDSERSIPVVPGEGRGFFRLGVRR